MGFRVFTSYSPDILQFTELKKKMFQHIHTKLQGGFTRTTYAPTPQHPQAPKQEGIIFKINRNC